MKLFTTFLLASVCTLSSLAQRPATPGLQGQNASFSSPQAFRQAGMFLQDSVLWETGVAGTNDFVSSWLIHLPSYNENGLLTEVVFFVRAGANWEHFSRKLYAYDGRKMTRYTHQVWDETSASWRDEYEEQRAYDGDDNLITLTTLAYDASVEGLVSDKRETMTYDNRGNLLELEAASWNGTGWEPETRRRWTYNQNDLFTQSVSQVWENGDWVFASRERATYGELEFDLLGLQRGTWDAQAAQWRAQEREIYEIDNRGQLLSTVLQAWNATSQSWIPLKREAYTYTLSRTYEQILEENWDGGWQPQTRRLFAQQQGQRETIRQSWENGEWVNQTRTYTRTNADDLLVEEVRGEAWSGSSWLNSEDTERYTYFWSEAVSTNLSSSLPSADCQLINPYRILTPIRCQGLEGGKTYQLELLDLQGRTVFQQAVRGGESFSIPRAVATGIYMLRLHDRARVVHMQKVQVE